MTQRERLEYRPPVASLDYNDYLRQALWNAINSFNTFQAESVMLPQMGSTFKANLATERFTGCMAVLQMLVLDDQMTSTYKAKMEALLKDKSDEEAALASFKVLHLIVELFNEKGIFRSVSTYGGHLKAQI